MTAGGSAEEQARRKREQARRLDEEAAAWQRGAEGERRVAHTLQGLDERHIVFHDLKLPAPSRANVDHLVVGPRGVLLIDTKNFTNPVKVGTGRGADRLWTGRRPVDFGPCKHEASVVSELIGVPVEPLMCIIAPSLPNPVFTFDGVGVCDPAHLVAQAHQHSGDPIDAASVARTVEQQFGVAAAQRNPTEVRSLDKRRAQPRRRARGQRRRPAARKRNKATESWITVLLKLAFVILLVLGGLALLPRATSWWQDHGAPRLADAITADLPTRPLPTDPDTTTAVAPSIAEWSPTTSCTGTPGAWSIHFAWPGDLPDDARSYHILWRTDDGQPITHTTTGWRSPDQAVDDLRIVGHTAVTLITEHRDGLLREVRSSEQLVSAPPECAPTTPADDT